jgi:prepilin-type N-terminal cleavage/methylation domain-containing protein
VGTIAHSTTQGEATVTALRARLNARIHTDSGLTLVELVIAIAILAVLSTASLGVYLSSLNAGAAQQRRQTAVTIASGVLENANTVAPASLYVGRLAADVEALRLENVGVPAVAQTYRTVGPVGTVTVPMRADVPLGGTTFKVNTIIGTCFQPKVGGKCSAPTGYPTQPTVPSNMTVLSRIVVVVRWSAGSTCVPTACRYVTSTLVDGNQDIKWNAP